MILEFKVGHDIVKITSAIASDNNPGYYKCKFYINKRIWKDTLLSVTFMNDIGYIETIRLGICSDVLTCIVPNIIQSSNYFSLYIHSDTKKTNTISLTLNNNNIQPTQKCNIISDIYGKINEKIDNVVYENNQLKFYADDTLYSIIYLGTIDQDFVRELAQQELMDFKEEVYEQLEECIKVDEIHFEDGILYIK